jgi:hypothetical protein
MKIKIKTPSRTRQEFDMSKKEIKIILKTALYPDTIGITKDGYIKCCWGFFYTNGVTSEDYVNAVKTLLNKNKIKFNIKDSGEVWKAFKGGASTANQSHWFVVIKIID